MYRKYLDLLIAAGMVLLTLVMSLTGVTASWLMLWFALAVVFVLPGYALMQLLTTPAMGWVERALFSISLSVLLTITGGLLLNMTSWGLRTETWIIWLGGVTLLAAGGAAFRRHRYLVSPALAQTAADGETANQKLGQHPDRLDEPVFTEDMLNETEEANEELEEPVAAEVTARGNHTGWKGSPLRPNYFQAVMLVAAVAVVVAAVLISRSGTTAFYDQDAFTQLWVLPGNGPDATGTPTSIRVGLVNQENLPMRYRVQIEIDGTTVKEWNSLELAAGKEWEATADLPADAGTATPATTDAAIDTATNSTGADTVAGRVEVNLYRLDDPSKIYHQVFLPLGQNLPGAASTSTTGQP